MSRERDSSGFLGRIVSSILSSTMIIAVGQIYIRWSKTQGDDWQQAGNALAEYYKDAIVDHPWMAAIAILIVAYFIGKQQGSFSLLADIAANLYVYIGAKVVFAVIAYWGGTTGFVSTVSAKGQMEESSWKQVWDAIDRTFGTEVRHPLLLIALFIMILLIGFTAKRR
jgi:hypothetical protein